MALTTPLSWKRQSSVSCALTLALIYSTAFAVEALPQSDAEWEANAVQLARAKNWTGLEALVRRWTELKPDDADAWGDLAEARCKLRQHDAAVAAFERQAKLQPNNPQPWHAMAACLGEEFRDFPGAVQSAQIETRVSPQNAEAWTDLAMQLENHANFGPWGREATNDQIERLQGQDLLEANKAYGQALKLGVNNPGWYWNQIASNYGTLGECKSAIDAYMKALSYNSRDQFSRNGLILESDALKSACTQYSSGVTPAPNGGKYVTQSSTWSCDGPTTALVQQAERITGTNRVPSTHPQALCTR